MNFGHGIGTNRDKERKRLKPDRWRSGCHTPWMPDSSSGYFLEFPQQRGLIVTGVMLTLTVGKLCLQVACPLPH